MAKKIEEFSERPKREYGERGSKWDQYMDGEIWLLEKEDFGKAKSVQSLIGRLYQVANNHGKKGRARLRKDGNLEFQAVTLSKEDLVKRDASRKARQAKAKEKAAA